MRLLRLLTVMAIHAAFCVALVATSVLVFLIGWFAVTYLSLPFGQAVIGIAGAVVGFGMSAWSGTDGGRRWRL